MSGMSMKGDKILAISDSETINKGDHFMDEAGRAWFVRMIVPGPPRAVLSAADDENSHKSIFVTQMVPPAWTKLTG